jgi:hypothetical protein
MRRKEKRTEPSLVHPFCRKREYRKKLSQYLDQYFSHRRCRFDLGSSITREARKEVFEALKDVDKRIVTILDALCSLMDPEITNVMRDNVRQTLTVRRTLIPEKTSCAGGNA